MLSYKEIRTRFQDHPALEMMLIDHYAKLLSPFLTQAFLRMSVIPNVATLFMMLSGIAGAILFALPWLGAKIAGTVFIHLWYIIDCSDGEIARITQRFSKFGKEIDYTAHIINHPLFNLAFLASLIQLGRYPLGVIGGLCLLSISWELVLRNLLVFNHIYEMKLPSGERPASRGLTLKGLATALLNLFLLYPTLALAFPILYLIDLRWHTSLALGYLVLQVLVGTLAVGRSTFKWLKKILYI